MRSRETVPGRLATVLCALVTACACAESEAPRQPGASPRPRATLVLEPARIGIGQVAELELAVVTPPGHVARPWAPPGEVAGLWILDVETLPVEKEPARWLHRTRLRVRARAVGTALWPAGSVDVEAPDGSVAAVTWEALAVEVPSVQPEVPGRSTPFGVRSTGAAALRDAPPAAFWGPAAGGALAALACVGLVALARRRRRSARSPPPEPAVGQSPPWTRALADLEAASALADDRPFAAAHATALALRRYVERRFGARAAGRTTEELLEETPPFAAASRWPALLRILQGLDALRFRAESDPDARRALSARLGDLLDGARHFVEDSIPPESRS